jgi:hypothetical protein
MMRAEGAMRRLLSGLTLWLLPVLAGAAPFWDIPAEELRRAAAAVDVAAYPKAGAVIIFDRREVEVEDSGLSRTVRHTLTRVLTAAGARELASQVLPYDPLSADVAVVRCRILTVGGVHEIDPGAVPDVPDHQRLIYWNSKHRLVPVGRLEPGDVVELVTTRVGFTYALLAGESGRAESRFVPPMKGHFYDIVPLWADFPAIEQRYRVRIPASKQLQYQTYNAASEISDRMDGAHRVVTVTLRGYVPFVPEPGMVALSDVAPKLLLTTAADWKAKALWFHGVQEVAGSFEVTPEVRELAEKVTRGLATPESKVAALNHWVAENIRYIGLHMGEGEGFTLHPAAMTLADRGGVCKDKAGILVALLRAVGLESYAAMTMAGERIEYLAADQFNHCVTVWRREDGEVVLLDPTWIPGVREMWSSREQQQEVLLGLPEGADLLTTPLSPPEAHPLAVAIRSRLDGTGNLEGTMTVRADGQSDAALRRVYRNRLRAEWRAVDEGWLSQVDPRAELTRIERPDPDDLSTPWAMTLSFRIVGYATRLDDGALLLTPLSARHPVGVASRADELQLSTKPETRRYPTRVGCTRLVNLTETLSLPPGSRIEGLPKESTLDGNGRLEASWTVNGDTLTVRQKLALTTRIIEPGEWPSLRAALVAFRDLAETTILVRPPARKEVSR